MTEHSATRTVPVGFRFHPTDEELVGYYLPKKVHAHEIDLDLIRDLDLYKLEPWDLQGSRTSKSIPLFQGLSLIVVLVQANVVVNITHILYLSWIGGETTESTIWIVSYM